MCQMMKDDRIMMIVISQIPYIRTSSSQAIRQISNIYSDPDTNHDNSTVKQCAVSYHICQLEIILKYLRYCRPYVKILFIWRSQ